MRCLLLLLVVWLRGVVCRFLIGVATVLRSPRIGLEVFEDAKTHFPNSSPIQVAMVKKKIDSRVRGLIESAAATNQRAMFVLVGDRGRDQVRCLGRAQRAEDSNKITRPRALLCFSLPPQL